MLKNTEHEILGWNTSQIFNYITSKFKQKCLDTMILESEISHCSCKVLNIFQVMLIGLRVRHLISSKILCIKVKDTNACLFLCLKCWILGAYTPKWLHFLFYFSLMLVKFGRLPFEASTPKNSILHGSMV